MWACLGPSRPRICFLGATLNCTSRAGCARIVCRIRGRQAARSSTILIHIALRGLPDIQIPAQHREHDNTKMVAILRNNRVTKCWRGCGNNIRPIILTRFAHGILGALMRDVTDCVRRALFGARLPEQLPQGREVANQLLRDQGIDRRCSERGCPSRQLRKNAKLRTSCSATRADAYRTA